MKSSDLCIIYNRDKTTSVWFYRTEKEQGYIECFMVFWWLVPPDSVTMYLLGSAIWNVLAIISAPAFSSWSWTTPELCLSLSPLCFSPTHNFHWPSTATWREIQEAASSKFHLYKRLKGKSSPASETHADLTEVCEEAMKEKPRTPPFSYSKNGILRFLNMNESNMAVVPLLHWNPQRKRLWMVE